MRRSHITHRGFACLALAAVLLALPLLGSGLAPAAHAGDEKDDTARMVEINLGPGDVLMEDFLKTLAIATGKKIVWDPRDRRIRGQKIVGGIRLRAKRSEIFSLVRSFLMFYELVAIPLGPDGDDILAIKDSRSYGVMLRLNPDFVRLSDDNLAKWETRDADYITTTIKVRHLADLRAARTALARFVTGQNIGSVVEIPEARAFVITDFAPRVVACYRLLRQMDVPGAGNSTPSGETAAFALEHAAAIETAAVLARQFPRGPRITPDARTNQLLVTGTAEQLEATKRTVAQLDVRVPRPKGTQPRLHFVRLDHVRAEEAARALTAIVATSSLFRASSPHERPARPCIVAHGETNALLICADLRGTEQLLRLLEEMDTKAAAGK